MSALTTIFLIIVSATITGLVIEAVRVYFHDDELKNLEERERND